MVEGDPRDQIQRLENQIEELADAIERCRKIILISKVAIAAGGLLIMAIVIGAIRFDPTAMVGAIAAALGGTVLLGSNSRTADEMTAQLRAAEVHRAELISEIDLLVVGDGVGKRLPRLAP